MENSKLNNGRIPAHTEYPFTLACPFKDNCNHLGVNHQVSFSCGTARAIDLLTKKG